jgi:hypothetical protein
VARSSNINLARRSLLKAIGITTAALVAAAKPAAAQNNQGDNNNNNQGGGGGVCFRRGTQILTAEGRRFLSVMIDARHIFRWRIRCTPLCPSYCSWPFAMPMTLDASSPCLSSRGHYSPRFRHGG